ncbi:CASC1 isoform 3 [Pan troglodytes]|nr:CASC1 isoform 3 [Pan troglodytes]
MSGSKKKKVTKAERLKLLQEEEERRLKEEVTVLKKGELTLFSYLPRNKDCDFYKRFHHYILKILGVILRA